MLSGPQTLTTNADVGARVCRSVDACNVILLQHEFVHMVEFYMRYITGVMDGYSPDDNKNIIFRTWLVLLVGHNDVENSL